MNTKYYKSSDSTYLRNVGYKIELVAKARNISLHELDKKLNICCSIYKVITGEKMLYDSELEQLSELLGISLEWLMDEKINFNYFE